MDEPGTGLDPRSRRKLITLLKEFEHSKLIATHDLDLALEVCQRILILDKGKIAAEGGPELLKDRKLMLQHGLDLPLSLQHQNQNENMYQPL